MPRFEAEISEFIWGTMYRYRDGDSAGDAPASHRCGIEREGEWQAA